MSSPQPAPPPPDNIFRLKNTFETLKDRLDKPIDFKKFDTLNREVAAFFSTAYNPVTTHTTAALNDNEIKIKSIQDYDTRYNNFVTACGTYVDKATAIFDNLDALITSSIKVDDSFYNDLVSDIPKLIKPITDAIELLQIPVPTSTSPPLSPIDLEKNNHLKILETFLDAMIKELIASIKTEVETEFSNAKIKKLIESYPGDFGKNVSIQVNNILLDILKYVNQKQVEFKNLLIKKSVINHSDNIIDNASQITLPFDSMISELKKYFAESGDDNTFYKVVDAFYFKEIQKIIEKKNEEVVALPTVPEMADAASLASPGGGGDGDGNGSRFTALVVSNKSQKNRNNGKGKGKGKGRKPNATKKNNRR